MPVNISIVEGDVALLSILSQAIDSAPEFKCVGRYLTPDTAVRELSVKSPEAAPDVVLIRMSLPSQISVRYVRQLKQFVPRTHIIMLAVYLDTECVFNALTVGATGCLLMRTPLPELMNSIRDIHEGKLSLGSQNARKLIRFFQKLEPGSRSVEKLSRREAEVLKLLAQGYDCQETARKLDLPALVIHAYVRDIYGKLHFCANTEEILRNSGEFIFHQRSARSEATLGTSSCHTTR
jgi:DNA-binding NarL/FixJ family response regulator